MTRFFLCGAALAALAACQPAVPDSGVGVGFDRIDAERRARDAQLSGGIPQTQPVRTTTLDASGGRTEDAEAARARAANSGVAPVDASPANAAPGGNSTGISNENDFNAVSGRRSIEADAARVNSNASQYQVVQPTAIPSRSGNSGPNVVAYALSTTHPKGAQKYRRSGFRSQTKFDRNCAVYSSADEAQIAFLTLGGPQKDKKGLDPDGDGYACAWDPAPFRAIRNSTQPQPRTQAAVPAQPTAAAAPQPSIVPAGAISTE